MFFVRLGKRLFFVPACIFLSIAPLSTVEYCLQGEAMASHPCPIVCPCFIAGVSLPLALPYAVELGASPAWKATARCRRL
jgi:hypothetical protein